VDMSILGAPRRATIAVVLAAVTAGLPGLAAAARVVDVGQRSDQIALATAGVPSRLVVFLPETVYVDHPFDIAVWIADDGQQLVKEGTSAVVTLTVDPGPMASPAAVLTCPGGLSARSNEAGPNAGLALFSGCTALRAGDFALDATASDVQSTIVPAPTIAAAAGVPLHVLASTEAPQEAMELTADPDGLPYAVVPWGTPIVLRLRFTEHGANQPVEIQESPRTTSSWRPVADLVTDANGTLTYTVRPGVSTWYRVVFAGSSELTAGRSRLFTALVRAVAKQRPVGSTPRVINRGATLRFETTVRPVLDQAGPMKVGFQLYHRVAGQWRLASLRTRAVDSAGVARINIIFAGAGEWYVRSYAKGQLALNAAVVPDVLLVALGQSEPTPVSRIRVR
jgi:hypothetical protein